MFKEILTENQKNLLPMIKNMGKGYYLAGGTAIALQIGHRGSIDFDLFSSNQLNTIKIISEIKKYNYKINATLEESPQELTMIIEEVKITFLEYPFNIESVISFDDIITIPDLLTLGAMKAYSLGRRSKWKDYVDLYFIIKNYFSVKEISKKAGEIFEGGFNEKLFREQLCYFADIDFSEKIEYTSDVIEDEEIKKFLMNMAVEL
ncbi:MAG: nucleotidyl transferase AbiEii/AbiGii toxin family protein [Candidatus Firestonebacteria bacterium]|nr:nucleotidyl transferase AbiEii/AbiGii toxin family protein [Candidatus Firestonebacteria bacterium]